MNRRTALIFYVLSAYVIIQFIWWAYHLIELSEELNRGSEIVAKRTRMVIGEGIVFLSLMFIGIWQIRKSILRDLKLSQRQKNFLLSVTHELKTPLAANKLYIQTVTKRDLDKEQEKELLHQAIQENVRLEKMIDNMLQAARIETNVLEAHLEPIDFCAVLNELTERFRQLKKKEDIYCECSPGLQLHSDRVMVESIMSNLIDNAAKYAPEDEITVYAFAENKKIVFGVRDRGKGIPKEAQKDIFKKFYRMGNEETRTQKGSGLGLYIVSELVKVLGGKIACLDHKPKGTDFRIILEHGT